MSTQNAVNIGLSGATGTGNFVGNAAPTINNPNIDFIHDTSGYASLQLVHASAAVNYVAVNNSATGFSPGFTATGSDSDLHLLLTSKGDLGVVAVTTALTQPFFIYNGTASQHLTVFHMANTAATRDVTFQDASGTVAYLSNITANGTVNSGTGNQLAYYATTGTVLSGLTGANSAMIYTNSSGVPAWSASLTNGQLMIGSTGSSPAPGTLTAGPGISISNGAASITISGTGSGIGWTEVTGTTQAITADNGYVANNAGLVTLTLPVTAAFGTVVNIIGKGAGGWSIAQNGGQNIQLGATSTTVGAGGSVASTNRYDGIELLCTTANTTWTAMSIQGNLTPV